MWPAVATRSTIQASTVQYQSEGGSPFDLAGLIEDLISPFGGRDSQPFIIPRKLRHRPHIIQIQYWGGSADEIMNQHQTAPGIPAIASANSSATPQLPPSACSYYDNLCAQSGRMDRYACSAGQCCRDYGNNSISNCVRGCLIQQDQRSCSTFLNPFKNACREGAHPYCWNQCQFPGFPPNSCLSTLGNMLVP